MQRDKENTIPGDYVHVIAGVANIKTLTEQLGDGESRLFIARALKRAEIAAKPLGGEVVAHAADHVAVLAPSRETGERIVAAVRERFASLWVPREAKVDYFVRLDENMIARRTASMHIRLSYGDTLYIVDRNAPLFTIGRRQSACLFVDSKRVSRQHATIELEDDRIVLADNSTNGTFVQYVDDRETFKVHHRKREIGRNAVISLGSSFDEGAGERLGLTIVKGSHV